MVSRALVAEDDEPIRHLIGTVLEREGLQVHAVKNGQEALNQISQTDFDVIVLDLMMPQVSGYEVLHYLRERKPEALKCLLVVTAVSERDLVRAVGTDPAFRVLRKPFELAELQQAVSACLCQREHYSIGITCLSCDTEERFDTPSEHEAREEARRRGWHVVSFVREDTATGQRKPLFVTFCPTCAKPRD